MNRIIIENGTVVTPFRTIDQGGVVIEEGVISGVFAGGWNGPRDGAEVVDAKGQYIAPGFIDIHTHGAGGSDFMDGTLGAFQEAAKTHLQHGTTTLVPTTLTSTMAELYSTLDLFAAAKESMGATGPNLHGIHLEGPYFSLEQKGAQDPRYIKDPTPAEYIEVLDYSSEIVRWTLAPEVPGALAMGRELRRRGVVPSIGHSNAVYEEVLDALANGFELITHLYSGMSGLIRIKGYRYAGVIETALLSDALTVEIIADGHHLPESLLKLIYKCKGSDRICLVTDSMRGAGMPDGTYRLGSLQDGQDVLVEEGVAKLPDRTAFAGSVATANRLLQTMVETAGVSIQEAVVMLTATPARVMGIADRKGALAEGLDADIVVFDRQFRVNRVFCGGKPVPCPSGAQ